MAALSSRMWKPWLQRDGSFIDYAGVHYSKNNIEELKRLVGNLPINQMEWVREKVIDILDSKDQKVLLVQWATGSGKTTQIPGMIVKHLLPNQSMVVTQPRVVAAMEAAYRVLKEMMLLSHDPSYAEKIGYKTSKEGNAKKGMPALFVTEGLQVARMAISKIVPNILVMDEVHEYHVETEMLLYWCKKHLAKNPSNFKLVLMSATMEAQALIDFLAPVCDEVVSLEVPGRTFPIEKKVVPGSQFVEQIVAAAKSGAHTMAFVEGKKQIGSTIEALLKKLPPEEFKILPFHSEITLEERREIFEAPTDGITRIIVATNVGESSLTIPYLTQIVSNGLRKVPRVDLDGIGRIETVNDALANAKQKAGRVGRVSEGGFTWANDDAYRAFGDADPENLDQVEQSIIQPYPTPEIERISLEKHVLLALATGNNPRKDINGAYANARREENKTGEWALNQVFLHQPDRNLLERTYSNLQLLGAIDDKDQLTNMGMEIMRYPIDPFIARMLCESVRRWCTKEMIPICAIMNERGFLGKSEGWKSIGIKKVDRTSDLFMHSKLFELVTSTKIDSDMFTKLKATPDIDRSRLKLFETLSRDPQNTQMLFEVVDLEAIGIKSKKVYDILKVMDALKLRLETSEEELQKSLQPNSKATDDNLHDVRLSIASGLTDRLFTWDREERGFSSKTISGGAFKKANTSVIEPGVEKTYIGVPFIIEWEDEDDVTRLLELTTLLTAKEVEEIYTRRIRKKFSGITFGSHTVDDEEDKRMAPDTSATTKRRDKGAERQQAKGDISNKSKRRKSTSKEIMAHVIESYQDCRLKDAVEALEEQDIQLVLTTVWLPDFLVYKNVSFAKWIGLMESTGTLHLPKKKMEKIKYRKAEEKEIDIQKFKELLASITKDTWHRFRLNRPDQTERSFKHDTWILTAFMQSQDMDIQNFLKNPYVKKK